jgi:L-malate glycosyltransferase
MWICKGLGLGGCEKNFTRILPHLDQSKFDYEVAYFAPWKNALVPELERANIPVFCLNHHNPFDPRGLFRLVRLLRERRPDILHMHLPYAAVFGRPAAKLAGVPATVYSEYNQWGRYHWLSSRVNQAMYTWTDAVVCVADVIYDSVRPNCQHDRDLLLRTIKKGVDWEEIAAGPYDTAEVRREFDIQDDEALVVNVASFTPRKRQGDLLHAAKMVLEKRPKTKFILVGDGPLYSSMVKLASELGIQRNVVFTGWREDAIRIMAASDVFVQASLYETMTVVLLEALSLNLPIIATRIQGDSDEVLTDGVTGFLVEGRDPVALAEKILALLESPELRRQVASNPHRQLLEKWDIKGMVPQLQELYTEILDQKGAKLRSRGLATYPSMDQSPGEKPPGEF